MRRSWLCFLVILALGYQTPSWADTVIAASCIPADVQTAITAAQVGDTVQLPTCTTAWTEQVEITKRLILQGTGQATTILQRSAGGELGMFHVDGVTGFEMRYLTLDGTFDTDPNVHKDVGIFLENCVACLIHHLTITNLAVGVEVQGDPTIQTALIYSNTFTDNLYNDGSSALGYGVVVYGDGTYPALDLGTETNVFVENNTFTRNRHSIAANNGARYVFRYNDVIDQEANAAAIDAHGQGVALPRGTRQYEVYGNTLTNAVARFGGVGLRGGDGVVFDNVFSCPTITEEVQITVEGGCTGGYPVEDQIRELYVSGNTCAAGGAIPAVFNNDAGCNPTYLQLDRDYFESARPGYTPFTYPHPLRTPAAPLREPCDRVENPLANGWAGTYDPDLTVAWLSNGTTCMNAGGGQSTTYWSSVLGADHSITARLSDSSTTGTNSFHLLVRLQEPSAVSNTVDAYVCRWQPAVPLADILRVTNGSNGTLISSTTALNLNDGDELGCQVRGSDISLWHKPTGGDWTEILTVSDANITGGGYVGMRLSTTTLAIDRVHFHTLTPLTETTGFAMACGVNEVDPLSFTVLTDSCASFPVCYATDTVKDMGDVTTILLPLDGFLGIPGYFLANPIDTSNQLIMDPGMQASIETVLAFGSSLVDTDVVRCELRTALNERFTSYPTMPTITISDPTAGAGGSCWVGDTWGVGAND